MSASARRPRHRFEMRVREFRERIDALVTGERANPRHETRVDFALSACRDALHCGLAEYDAALRPLVDAFDDASAALERLDGLGDPGLQAILHRIALLLENVLAGAAAGLEADAIRAQLATVVSDIAWRRHAGTIPLESHRDDPEVVEREAS